MKYGFNNHGFNDISFNDPWIQIPLDSTILNKQSLLQETLNLLTCADSSTDTKTERNGQKGYCMSCVTFLLSLTPTATSTDPHPGNSPIKHSRLACKDPKSQKQIKTQKIIETTKTRNRSGLAIIPFLTTEY